MDVTDSGVGPAERGVHPGVVEPVAVDFIEAEGYVERRSAGFLVLSAEVGEELVAGDGEVPHPALQEVAGQGGLGRDQ